MNNPAVAYAYLVGKERGAISHWALDETSGTTFKDTTSGYHGIIYPFAAAPHYTLGLAGPLFGWTNYATQFDSASIVVPYQPAMKLHTALTIEAWMNVSATQPGSWRKVMWMGTNGSYCSGQGPWGFETYDNTAPDLLVFHVAVDTGGNNQPRDIKGVIQTPLKDGLWHHVVGVFDASGATNDDMIRVYVDGVRSAMEYWNTTNGSLQYTAGNELVGGIIPERAYLRQTGAVTGMWTSNTCADAEATPSKGLAIAGANDNAAVTDPPTLTNQRFVGKFSHMAFYSVALTDAEVLNHYNQGKCGNPTCSSQ